MSLNPGIYTIQVDLQTMENVYCMADGWTVIQSRGQYGNGEDYFYNTWAEYKAGFGTPGKYITQTNQIDLCDILNNCIFSNFPQEKNIG